MNWFHMLVLAFTIVGGSVMIPAAFRHDRALRELEAMPHNHAPADELQHFIDHPEGES